MTSSKVIAMSSRVDRVVVFVGRAIGREETGDLVRRVGFSALYGMPLTSVVSPPAVTNLTCASAFICADVSGNVAAQLIGRQLARLIARRDVVPRRQRRIERPAHGHRHEVRRVCQLVIQQPAGFLQQVAQVARDARGRRKRQEDVLVVLRRSATGRSTAGRGRSPSGSPVPRRSRRARRRSARSCRHRDRSHRSARSRSSAAHARRSRSR